MEMLEVNSKRMYEKMNENKQKNNEILSEVEKNSTLRVTSPRVGAGFKSTPGFPIYFSLDFGKNLN